jgi:uncharacterized RDD family membrane protein YckC
VTGESGVQASLGRRIAAFGVDYVVISIYMLLLVLVGFTVPSFTRVFESPFGGQVAGIAVLTLPVMLYFSLWEASQHAATPGKRALGVRALRSTGERLTLGRSVARSAVKFIPWELAHTFLWRIPGWPQPEGEIPAWIVAGFVVVWSIVALNVVLVLRTKRGQTAYDLAADSVVVRYASSRRLPDRGTGV